MFKIDAELQKLSKNKTGYPFFGPPCSLLLGGGGYVTVTDCSATTSWGFQ